MASQGGWLVACEIMLTKAFADAYECPIFSKRKPRIRKDK
jgi:hypothetical protein